MKTKKAFTLVELLIYITLVSIFITGAITFTWDVIYGRERSLQKEVIDLNMRSAMARIGYELRNAKTVDSFSSNSLDLENNDGTITNISLVNGKIQISPSGAGPYDLTSNQVKVSDLTFKDYSSTDQNSKNIQFSVTMQPLNLLPGQKNDTSTTLTQSIEFNSQFNLARQILIDLSGATFTGSYSLTNAKLRNTGAQDILIDKLIISWTNPSPSQQLTEVQIAGGDVEWSGSAPSGQEIDITDFLLPAYSSQTPINHLQFNSDLSNELVFMTFVLSDGSSTTGVIDLGGSGSSGSCYNYCSSLNYSAGTCRRRPSLCTDNSETYESGGDQFCTINPDDTCCCAP